MAGQSVSKKYKSKSITSMKIGTSTSKDNSPTLDELKKDLFIAIEVLNGYTEHEALLNWQCTQGTCQCP